MRRDLALVLGLLAFIVILGCLGGGGGGGGGGSPTGPTTPTGIGISGRIYFSDRQLYGGITVLARNLTGKTVATVRTDGTGNFSFGELPGGVYDLVALSGDAEVTFAPSVQVVEGSGKAIPETPLLSLKDVILDSITSGSVHISFRANQACTSQVDYGTAAENPRTQTVRTEAGTGHDTVISGLLPQTRYSFTIQIRGTDGQIFKYLGLYATTTPAAGPTKLGISINTGQFETRSTNVTLSLAADNATQMRVGESEELADQPWETFLPTRDFALSVTDGTKRVYVQFRDANGNISPVVSDAILLSTSRNGYIGVWIDGGKTITNKTDCVLTMIYPGAEQMRVSERPDFVNSFWEAFVDTRRWTLTTGDGTKRVYVQFRGGSANPNDVFSSSIVLDTAGPAVVMKINNGAAKTNNPLVTLSFTSSKTPTHMQLTNGSTDFANVDWVSYGNSVSWSLDWTKTADDGRKTIYARFRDSLGNLFGPVGESIIIDTVPPVNPSFTIEAGSFTNSLNVRLLMSSEGAQSMIFSNTEDFVGAVIEPFRTSKPWVMGGYGKQAVFGKFYDDASNSTDLMIRYIEVIQPSPGSDSILINGGDAATDRIAAQLKLFSGNAVRMRLSQNANFNAYPDLPYTASMPYTLARQAGSQTVAVRFENASGEYSIVWDMINVIGPSSPTLSILDPQPVTSLTVQARPFAIFATEMLLTEDYNSLSNDTLMEPYAPNKLFSMQPFSGWHTIYAKFRNAGGVDTLPVSINVQATGTALAAIPPPSVIINDGDATTNQIGANLLLDSGYSRLNLDQMWITNTGNFYGATGRPYVKLVNNWQLDSLAGIKTVSVRFTTSSGAYVLASDTITLVGPASPTLSTSDLQPINNGFVNLDLLAIGASEMLVTLDSADLTRTDLWIPYATRRQQALLSIGGQQTVFAKFRNVGGVETAPISLTVRVSSTPPSGNTAVFRPGIDSAATALSEVTLASMPVYLHFNVSDVNTASLAWSLVDDTRPTPTWPTDFTVQSSPQLPRQLSQTSSPALVLGNNILWYRFADGRGNWSDLRAATLKVSTPPVSSATVAINGGDAFTDTRNVTLTLSSPQSRVGVERMWISPVGIFSGTGGLYAVSSTATLLPQAGEQTVYARFQTQSGGYDYASDKITLVGPTNVTFGTRDPQPINQGFVNLDLFAENAVDMAISLASTSMANPTWIPYATTYQIALPSGTTTTQSIFARFRNAGGVWSPTVMLTVSVNSAAPTGNDIKFRAGSSPTSAELTRTPIASLPAYLHFNVVDASTASAAYALVHESDPTPVWPTGYTTLAMPQLPRPVTVPALRQGVNYLWYRFADGVGNWSAQRAISLTVDSNPVSSATVAVNNGEDFSDSILVSATLNSPNSRVGIDTMWLSSTGVFSGAGSLYATTAAFSFPPQAGEKTLYAKFLTASGSFEYASDKITLLGPASSTISTRDSQPINQTFVNLDLLSEGASWMALSLDSARMASPSWIPFTPNYALVIASGTSGAQTVYGRFRNDGGVWSPVVTLPINVSPSPPANNTMKFLTTANPSSAEVTRVGLTGLPVYMHFVVTDVNTASAAYALVPAASPTPVWPADYVQVSIPQQSKAVTTTTTPSVQLGSNYLWYRFADGVGNWSSIKTTILDLDPYPAASVTTTVTVNNGDGATDQIAVTLSLTQLNADVMWLSNTPSFPAGSTPFASTTAWVLDPLAGEKTVYAKLRSTSGLYEYAQDTITLLGPASPTISTRDIQPINSGFINLDLLAEGAASMVVSLDQADMYAPVWETATKTKVLALAAGRSPQQIYARFKNAGGVWSKIVSLEVTVSNTPPSGNTVAFRETLVPTSAALTQVAIGSLPAFVHFGITDAKTQTVGWQITGPGQGYPATFNLSGLPISPFGVDIASPAGFALGLNTIWTKYADGAGNWSAVEASSLKVVPNTVSSATVVINDGDASTDQAAVTLTLSQPNASTTWISNIGLYTGAGSLFVSPQAWNLDPEAGLKTVYVKFRNASGAIEYAQDTITLVGPSSFTITTTDTMPINRGYVNLKLTAQDAASMAISLEQNDMASPTWQPFAQNSTFPLAVGQASQRIYARVSNLGGVRTEVKTLDVTVNTAAPTGNTAAFKATINPTSTTLTETSVGSLPAYVHFAITDGTTASVAWALTGPGAPYPNWPGSYTVTAVPVAPFEVSRTTSPALGEGQNTLWMRSSDGNGNWSDISAVSLKVTPWPSTSLTIAVNGGDSITDRRDVYINVSAPDQATMWLSNDGNFSAATPIVPPTAPASAAWYLAAPARAGTKTVYARFQNASGAYSYAQDTITAVGPASATISTRDTQPLNSNFVNLDLFADGASDMFLTEDPASLSATIVSWIPYQGSYVFTPLKPGLAQHTIYARFRNSFGNNGIEAAPVSVVVTSRTTAPTGNTASLRESAVLTSPVVTTAAVGSLPIYLHFTINDAGTATISYAVASAGAAIPTVFTTVAVPPAPIPLYSGNFPGYGPFNVWYKFSDNLGNTTAVQAVAVEILGPNLKISPNTVAALKSGESQQFTATLKNTTGNIVWKLYDPSGVTPALPVSTYGNLDSLNGKYTAPSPVRIATYVTVHAELQTDPTVKDDVQVNLNPQIEVYPSVLQVSAKYNETKTFTVTFENSAAVTATGGVVVSSPVGYGTCSITLATISSPLTDAIATVSFTAGAGAPSQNPVILTITSLVDPSKSKTVSVDIRSGEYIQVNPATATLRLKTGKLTIAADVSTPSNIDWSATVGTVNTPTTAGPHQITFTAPTTGGIALVTASPSSAIGYQATVTITLTPAVKVVVSPANAVSSVATTTTVQFYSQVENATTSQVTWEYISLASYSVSPTTAVWAAAGIATNPSPGFLASNASFLPPSEQPTSLGFGNNSILIRATSIDDPTASAVAQLDLQEPLFVKIHQGYNAGDPILTLATVTLEIGQIQMFGEVGPAALVSNYTVTWKVEDVANGNSTYGTVDSTGLFKAPDTRVKSPVIVKAVSNQDVSKFASASINLQDFWAPRSDNLKDVTNATFSITSVMVDPTTLAANPKILYVGTNGNGVWKATVADFVAWNTVTWAPIGLSTTAVGAGGQYVINDLTMSKQNPGRIVAATSNGAWLSTDAGVTFAPIPSPTLASPPAAFPSGQRDSRLYQYLDGSGAGFTNIISGVAIDPVDDTYLYVVGKNQGVLRYRWNAGSYAYSSTLYDDQVRYDLVYYDPRTWIEAVGSPAVPVTRNYEVPYKVTTASQSIQLNCITVDAQNPNVVYVGYSKYLKTAPSTFENGYIKFSNARNAVEYMDEFVATPKGDLPPLASPSWWITYLQPVSNFSRTILSGSGIPLSMAVDPNTPTTIWVGKDDGVLRSTNDGTTFSSLNTYTNVRKILIDPINTINVYIGTENGLYRSSNAGTTWKQIKSGLEGHTTINGFGLSPGGWGNRRIFSGTTAGVYMGVTTLDF